MLRNFFKERKRKKVLITIVKATSVCLLILLYFVFLSLIFREKELDLVEMVSKEKRIVVKNKLPLSDEVGIKIDGSHDDIEGYLEFSVKNKTSRLTQYYIYVEKTSDSEIADNRIKLYLTDEDNNPTKLFKSKSSPLYSDFLVDSYHPAGRVIYKGILKGYGEDKFILRSWLSEFYSLTINEEKYDLVVGVHSL